MKTKINNHRENTGSNITPNDFFFRPFTLAKQGRITEYLQKIHEYMMTLHYNHTGTQFFETKPNR